MATQLQIRSTQAQIIAGVLLALMLVATRGNHVASIDVLPSASWAVFFLAGALLRPHWMFPLFFLLASLVDVTSMSLQEASAHCVSPAYWTLIPAYFSLWWGGRLYARRHVDAPRTVAWLLLILVASGFVAYQFSGGGYYLLSGTYTDPTLVGHVERVLHYLPQRVLTLAGYVVAALGLRACMLAMAARAPAATSA